MAVKLAEHPIRQALHEEIHARPSVPLVAPATVVQLSWLLPREATSERLLEHWMRLRNLPGAVLELDAAAQSLLRWGGLRIKRERHAEFHSYTFYLDGDHDSPAAILSRLPEGWLEASPGEVIAATHVRLRPVSDTPPSEFLDAADPFDPALVASKISDGNAWVLSDFQLHEGFIQFIVLDAAMTPKQAGRAVQRLLEIDTYRMLALLAFPVAKEVGAFLGRAEAELAELVAAMSRAASFEDERDILARLTHLAAEIEHSIAASAYRFGAATAYSALVRQRIAELREIRLAGYSTLQGFMERRFAPAMNTCAAVARRQEELSQRSTRNSQLLRTRVDLELERQNQQLLAQMNRRVKLQLRLQAAVESLSVMAITYYGSQLVHYLAKGFEPWLHIKPELATAVSIPLLAALIALGVRRVHRVVEHEG